MSTDELRDEIRELRQEMREEIRMISAALGNLRNDVTMLQVKAGLWGAIAGALPVLILLGIQALRGQP